MLRERSRITGFMMLMLMTLMAAMAIWGMPAIAVADSALQEPQATVDRANPQTIGTQVFQAHCEGCHINGGNIIRRGKTLKLKALQQNGMDSPEAIVQIVTNGKNNMSAFRDRLTKEQIEAVAAYVLDRAQADWKKS